MPDLLTETEAAEKPAEGSPAPSAKGDQTADSIPAYLAGATKEQKERIAKLGVKLPGKITEFFDVYLDLHSRASNGQPGKDAPEDQWQAWRKANGVPETPDGYVLEKPKLPEGLSYNDALETWWRTKARALNLPQATAQEIFAEATKVNLDEASRMKTEYDERQKQIAADRETEAQSSQEALKTKYGQKYSQVVLLAQKVYNGLSATDKKRLASSGLLNSERLISIFYEYGRAASPESLLTETPSAPAGAPEKSLYGSAFDERYKK